MVSTKPTGTHKQHIKSIVSAAELLIMVAANRGDKIITLDELCYLLGAYTRAKRISVLWAVRHCKDDGVISKIKGIKRVYQVCV